MSSNARGAAAAWAVVAAVGMAGCPPVTAPPEAYRVPPELWGVELLPAAHHGQPGLEVSIDEGFDWPAPVNGEPVSYRLDVEMPDGRRVAGVGRLTEEERFSVLFLMPERLASELEVDPAAEARRLEEQQAALLELLEQPVPRDREGILDRLDGIEELLPPRGPEAYLDERQAVAQYEVTLIPFAGDRALLRQEGPGRVAAPPRFTWGTPADELPEPCTAGMTPEECVRARIERFFRRVCEPAGGQVPATLPEQFCARFRAILANLPPEPRVECTLPAEAGVTAGITDPVSGLITLNGEHNLTGDCAEATILHELVHSLDRLRDAAPELQRFAEAERRAQEADAEARRLLDEDDLEGAARAFEEGAAALAEVARLEQEAGRQLIDLECRAFFAAIDNGALFGYPGEGNAWMKANVRDMVGEVAGLRGLFNLPFGSPPVRGELCACFRRIRAYVAGQEPLRENFARDLFVEEPPMTWTEAIDGLTLRYCEG